MQRITLVAMLLLGGRIAAAQSPVLASVERFEWRTDCYEGNCSNVALWYTGTTCNPACEIMTDYCGVMYQSRQPSPEAVTRTIAPVTAMPPWVKTTAAAMMR